MGKRNTFSLESLERQTAIVTWQETLRQVIYDGIKSDDVKAIVQKLVERAKEGDPQATKMVFDYILGGRGTTNIRDSNVVIAPEVPPQRPTRARGGSNAKLAVLAERARHGETLCHALDERRTVDAG